ncbi:MAG: alpha/beta fold hydrolase [Deltaproteobacteria bacterium]|nr:alpha/beta fold hydrolase [Deltaproteobacteria bacterium]
MAFAEIAGRKVYYELHGPTEPTEEEQPPPLMLIMGMGGSCRGWLPLQVPDFSKSRKTLVFDNRGVGESEDPGTAFSTADLADDAAQLLTALAISKADVLGAFMGGMAAQELALRYPERVRSLVLTGTYSRPDAKRRMLLSSWADLAHAGISDESMLRRRLVWTLQDETLEQTDLIESMVQFYMKEGSPLSPELFARQCAACIDHDSADRLREITQPTLVVCGRNDQLTPPKFHRELADEIPGAHLITIHYGGHLVMAESAERFNQVVLQFLRDQ